MLPARALLIRFAILCFLTGCKSDPVPPEPESVDCTPIPEINPAPAVHESPAWSFQGMIAYFDRGVICFWPPNGYRVDDALTGLWVLDPEKRIRKRILAWRGFPEFPQWSPDGSRLLLSARQIWVLTSDGTTLTPITEPGHYYYATWSPDGQRIAYDDASSVWVMGSDGTERRDIGRISSALDSRKPSWHPDGEHIVHVRYVSPTTDLFVMNSDGLELTRLTFDDAYENDPTFSPDGQRIAYSRQASQGFHQIWIVNSDGGNPRRLTSRGGVDPTWSPDGTKIAFSRMVSPCADPGTLFALDIGTGQETQLTEGWPRTCDSLGLSGP